MNGWLEVLRMEIDAGRYRLRRAVVNDGERIDLLLYGLLRNANYR